MTRPARHVSVDGVRHLWRFSRVNSQPDCLDLRDEDTLRAREYGVRFAVDTDAHAVPHLAYLRYGVGTAQRGWLTAEAVINTWPLQWLRRFLRKEWKR